MKTATDDSACHCTPISNTEGNNSTHAGKFILHTYHIVIMVTGEKKYADDITLVLSLLVKFTVGVSLTHTSTYTNTHCMKVQRSNTMFALSYKFK